MVGCEKGVGGYGGWKLLRDGFGPQLRKKYIMEVVTLRIGCREKINENIFDAVRMGGIQENYQRRAQCGLLFLSLRVTSPPPLRKTQNKTSPHKIF